MSRAVVVVAPDSWSKTQLEITRPHMETYAKNYNADFIVLEKNLDETHPCNNKWQIKEVTDVYDQTLYLDCDVLITNKCPNVFIRIPNGYFGLIDEAPILRQSTMCKRYFKEYEVTSYEMNLPPQEKIGNLGVMVLPKGQTAYTFQEGLTPCWCLDQFILALRNPPSIWLPNLFNLISTYPDWKEMWHRAYMLHTAGVGSKTRRLSFLKQISKDYGL